eukprot:scaffold12894_cov120-Cylindrotheca_fusiformis.AAC.3
MEHLRELHLADNNLSGSIPLSLSNDIDLESLSVEENALTGSIPDSVCDLTEVGKLVVVAADCYEVVPVSNTVLDLSDMKSLETGMAGELGQLTEENEKLVEFEGIVCACCTICF